MKRQTTDWEIAMRLIRVLNTLVMRGQGACPTAEFVSKATPRTAPSIYVNLCYRHVAVSITQCVMHPTPNTQPYATSYAHRKTSATMDTAGRTVLVSELVQFVSLRV
jgi:hypothetical protein